MRAFSKIRLPICLSLIIALLCGPLACVAETTEAEGNRAISQTEHAVFTIKEALCLGTMLLFTVNARPTQDGISFIGEDQIGFQDAIDEASQYGTEVFGIRCWDNLGTDSSIEYTRESASVNLSFTIALPEDAKDDFCLELHCGLIDISSFAEIESTEMAIDFSRIAVPDVQKHLADIDTGNAQIVGIDTAQSDSRNWIRITYMPRDTEPRVDFWMLHSDGTLLPVSAKSVTHTPEDQVHKMEVIWDRDLANDPAFVVYAADTDAAFSIDPSGNITPYSATVLQTEAGDIFQVELKENKWRQ